MRGQVFSIPTGGTFCECVRSSPSLDIFLDIVILAKVQRGAPPAESSPPPEVQRGAHLLSPPRPPRCRGVSLPAESSLSEFPGPLGMWI